MDFEELVESSDELTGLLERLVDACVSDVRKRELLQAQKGDMASANPESSDQTLQEPLGDPFLLLPDEIIVKIFSFLDLADIMRMAVTCRRHYFLASGVCGGFEDVDLQVSTAIVKLLLLRTVNEDDGLRPAISLFFFGC